MSKNFRRMGFCFEPIPAYYMRIIEGIGDYYHRLRNKQWEFFPWLTMADVKILIHQKKLDGLIVAIYNSGWMPLLKNAGIPTVEVSCCGQTDLPRVGVNEIEVGQQVAQYFLQHGYHRLAYCGLQGVPYAEARGQGFVQAAGQAGLNVQMGEILSGDQFHLSILDQMFWLETWVKTLSYPIGVFACNDVVGMLMIQACRLAGIRVPEDLAVVGVDNDVFLCQFPHPPLSSIDTLSERIGFEAAALLDRLMDGQPAPDRPVLISPGPITTRQSSDLVAVEDEAVREALQFIRTRIGRRISVKEVVAEVLVSRSLLERRFRSVLGRTIRQEIQRITIERAKELLTYTHLSLSEVAKQCGFPLLCHFSTVFRRQTKTSPSAFRRRMQTQK